MKTPTWSIPKTLWEMKTSTWSIPETPWKMKAPSCSMPEALCERKTQTYLLPETLGQMKIPTWHLTEIPWEMQATTMPMPMLVLQITLHTCIKLTLQAKHMVTRSHVDLRAGSIWENVAVPIPTVDRGRWDPRNILFFMYVTDKE